MTVSRSTIRSWARPSDGASAVISSTTGSPTTGTFTGTDNELYNYWKWTANGSCTFSTAGRVKVLVIGGGGGSGNDGAGGGGGYEATDLNVLTGEAYPVSIGSGGAGAADTAANGGNSNFGPILALGGGSGAGAIRAATTGASGGGGGRGAAAGAAALNTYGPQGFAGGTSAYTTGIGAGGGAGAAATDSLYGLGKTWINGVEYSRGGANTGGYILLATPSNSGYGANSYNMTGAAGVVIIAIRV